MIAHKQVNSRLTATMVAAAVSAAAGGAVSAMAAPTDLYSNGSATPGNPGLATGGVTASGVAAPASMVWSEVQADSASSSNAVIGFSSQAADGGALGSYRFADNFTVPASATSGWEVRTLVVFAYQPGALGPASPFATANLRVWRGGPPGSPGATVLFGNTSTDRLATVALTNMLRVPTTAVVAGAPASSPPDSTRPIWRLELAINAGGGSVAGLKLQPGTYWVDWQIACVSPLGEAFSPPVTVPGARAKAGPAGDALQLRLAPPPALDGQWLGLIDEGKPAPAADVRQELAFIIRGVVPCTSADIAATDGTAGADGAVDNGDFSLFFSSFFVGCDFPGQVPCAPADIAGTDSTPGADGAVDNGDFSLFFSQFFVGC